MKMFKPQSLYLLFLFVTLTGLLACESSEDTFQDLPLTGTVLSDSDSEALYFMLEEEKLARDVYTYLGVQWEHPTFLNIQQSEARHMEAVISLLQAYDLPYSVEMPGVFQNEELQELYDSLTLDGSTDLASALKVGALIEDLDIVDLQNYMDATDNPALIQTFGNLQCGSENHLRSFTDALSAIGESYTPQFLPVDWYQAILEATQTGCGR